jgi:hypothetical protein
VKLLKNYSLFSRFLFVSVIKCGGVVKKYFSRAFVRFFIDCQRGMKIKDAKNITKISHYYHSEQLAPCGFGVCGAIKVGRGIDNSKTNFYDRQLSVV